MLKSINHKAIGLSAAVALLVATCCGIGAWVALNLLGLLEESSRSTAMIQTHMDADMMHDALRADVLAAIVARDEAFGISQDDVRKDLAEHAAQFRKDIADNTALAATEVEKALLGQLKDPLEAYITGAEEMVDLIDRNPAEAAGAMPEFLRQFEALEGAMSDASTQFEAQQRVLTESGESQGRSARVYMFSLLGISIALAGLMAFMVRKSLVRPLLEMAAAMRRLAGGDLSAQVPSVGRSDEIGAMAQSLLAFREGLAERQKLEAEAAVVHQKNAEQLKRTEEAFRAAGQEQTAVVGLLADALAALAGGDLRARIAAPVSADYQRLKDDYNAAIDKLERAMHVIAANASGIQSGTVEISSASDDLARRTEQQAASLEETAAALDQITATMKKSAEGAMHAREIVAAADGDAKKSAVVVRQAVEAMDGIASSSQQINQIIGVIDEIAFQTNLLALNAGVEAARAGDAGRGFAVVASEVRALAQRSADAAKEIKGLISTSATHVELGIKLVAETGKALERIVAQVTEINDVVSAIASGAREQAMGLEQVNTAINEMDQVTQKNAAMVEESTAAAHSLSKETLQLADLIGQFQLGASEGDEAMRRELRKAAPHAFRPPAGQPAPEGRTEPRVVMGGARQAKRSRAAAPVAVNANAANGEAEWEAF